MNTKRIIPCLDVQKGRVVKGVSFGNLRDAGDPVELAALYDRVGADELVLLDISTSLEERKTMTEVIRKAAGVLSIPLTVGGGIHNTEDMLRLLRAGADKVSVNTAAVKTPDLVKAGAKRFGSQCIVVAIDACYDSREKDWFVYTHGGRRRTNHRVLDWVQEVVELGAGEILLTSMDQDGRKNGYDLDLTRTVSDQVSVPVIASGGAGKEEHFVELFNRTEADAALAASIFHYHEVSIPGLKKRLKEQGGADSLKQIPELSKINYDSNGLIPAIVQDAVSKEVLTLAYMNEESLRKTLETKETWFWSRSRQRLWHKGETSGHTQRVISITEDCDRDALLVRVVPSGPACHTGKYSCFTRPDSPVLSDRFAILNQLEQVIARRGTEKPKDSYTTYLFQEGVDKILKKVGEEAGEVIIAAKNRSPDELAWEISDLLYHLLVLLREQNLPLDRVLQELQQRHGGD